MTCGDPTQVMQATRDDGGQVLHEVADQVEPVEHPYRLRSAQPHGPSELTGAVATDQANGRVCLEPGDDGCRFLVWQEIHHAMALQIDEDGAKPFAPAITPLVDSNLL